MWFQDLTFRQKTMLELLYALNIHLQFTESKLVSF